MKIIMDMEEKKRHTVLERVAQVLSDLFSPIVLPAYMMAVAMWVSPLSVAPERVRLFTMGIVIALTAVVPTAVILVLIKLGKVKDVSLSDRSERFIPYVVSIVCYLATALFLSNANAPMWLRGFYLGAALAGVIAYVITSKWKISAHSSSVGGVAAALAWMCYHGLLIYGPMIWVSAAIVLSGLIGTSRLILRRHTPAQVFAGYCLGAGAELIVLVILG